MVQEKIGSNQSAVNVPKCKHTQHFNKGPGDLTPKFYKHQPLARSPTSTVTSKARALSAHQTCIKPLWGRWPWILGFL